MAAVHDHGDSASGMHGTFLYLAADLDVQMLRLLRWWETRAVLVDPIADDWSSGQGYDVVSDYQRKHVNDKRVGHRENTQPLRPWRSTPLHIRTLALVLGLRMA